MSYVELRPTTCSLKCAHDWKKNYRRTAEILRIEVAVYVYRDSQIRSDFGLKLNVIYTVYSIYSE